MEGKSAVKNKKELETLDTQRFLALYIYSHSIVVGAPNPFKTKVSFNILLPWWGFWWGSSYLSPDYH